MARKHGGHMNNFMDNWIAKSRRTDDHDCEEIINNIGTVFKTSTETSTRTTPVATTVYSTTSSPAIVGLLPSSSGRLHRLQIKKQTFVTQSSLISLVMLRIFPFM